MITIYTDGSARPNPGQGGAGVVIVHNDTTMCATMYKDGGPQTTNNRMELMAVIMALDVAVMWPNEPITIYTDSNYVKDGINQWMQTWIKNGWVTASKEPVKNKDLWLKLMNIPQHIKIEWVKAHSTNQWNQMVDKIAKNDLV